MKFKIRSPFIFRNSDEPGKKFGDFKPTEDELKLIRQCVESQAPFIEACQVINNADLPPERRVTLVELARQERYTQVVKSGKERQT